MAVSLHSSGGVGGLPELVFPRGCISFYLLPCMPSWRSTVRIMAPTHHAMRTVCEHIKTYLRTLPDPAIRGKMKELRRMHVHNNLQDRRVNTRRASQQGEHSCRTSHS